MTILPAASLPHVDQVNREKAVDYEYMERLVAAIERQFDQLNTREPLKNNVVVNPASGDYMQYDGQTWRNVRFPMASFYIASGDTAVTDLVNQNEWVKAAGTTTDVTMNDFDGKTALSVDNRIKYTGTVSTHVHGVVSFSSEAALAGQTLEYAAYHYDDSAASGSILDHSIVSREHGSTDIGTGAIHWDVMMDTNDYLEFHIRQTDTPVNDPTIRNLYFFVMGMG